MNHPPDESLWKDLLRSLLRMQTSDIIVWCLNFPARAFAVAFALFFWLQCLFVLAMASGAPKNDAPISSEVALFLAKGLLIAVGVGFVALCAIFPNIFARIVPSHWRYRRWYGMYVVYLALPFYLTSGMGTLHFARVLLFVTER